MISREQDISTANAKPFVKWVGGKRQLLAEISGVVSPLMRDRRVTTCVEPFEGVGAVLGWILETVTQIRQAVISDTNTDWRAANIPFGSYSMPQICHSVTLVGGMGR